MTQPENPSAFPVNTANDPNPGAYGAEPGMTLRDHFASQALVGLLSSGKWDNCGDGFEAFIADRAGLIADAMLRERAKPVTVPAETLQHVAYFDEGQFHWMSGIAPRDCELFAKAKGGAL